jgi:hypothetical protein
MPHVYCALVAELRDSLSEIGRTASPRSTRRRWQLITLSDHQVSLEFCYV